MGYARIILVYLLAGASIVHAGVTTAPAAVPPPIHIVLIGHAPDHPYGTHAYLPDCKLLAKCLEQTPRVRTVVSDGWPSDAGVLDRAAAIVLFVNKGGNFLYRSDHADAGGALMKRGVGLTAIHCG